MQREFLPHIFGTNPASATPTGPSQTSASEIQTRNLSERIRNLDRIVLENDTRVMKIAERLSSFEADYEIEMNSLIQLRSEVEKTFKNLSTSTETRYTTLEGRVARLTEVLKESLVREEELRNLMDRTQATVNAAEARIKQMKAVLDRKESELLSTRSLVGEMKAEIEKLKRL